MKYTSEEKEAIQKINNFKSIKLLYGKIYAMHLEQLKKYQTASEVILNLLEKYQKEIEKKDIERELALKGKQAEIEDNMREIIKEYYIPIEKYRQLEESCVSKESIKSILNKYGKKPIDKAVNFYKEIVELLGE